jgi:hypothetical protein
MCVLGFIRLNLHDVVLVSCFIATIIVLDHNRQVILEIYITLVITRCNDQ